jgi:F-type H+-transporting ATPase subunit b
MLIDWFTVGAQTLNFLVLVWLMKRFLYQPVLNAIDAREQRIAKTLADAASQQATAQQEREAFAKRNADFDSQHASTLSAMTAEVAAERGRLLEEARQSADTLHTQQQRALSRELQQLQKHIAQRSRDEVLAMASTVLAELADASLEAQMVVVFARKLHALDDDARAGLAKALASATPSQPVAVQVRSAFALTPEQQATLQQALHDGLACDVPLRFSTSPEVLAGIELSANGWKVAWHLADGLASLAQNIAQAVPEPTDDAPPDTPPDAPAPAAADSASTDVGADAPAPVPAPAAPSTP